MGPRWTFLNGPFQHCFTLRLHSVCSHVYGIPKQAEARIQLRGDESISTGERDRAVIPAGYEYEADE